MSKRRGREVATPLGLFFCGVREEDQLSDALKKIKRKRRRKIAPPAAGKKRGGR